MNRDSTRSPESSAALRRLLSSHHSIYNTLTDPLLECASPPRQPHPAREDESHVLSTHDASNDLKSEQGSTSPAIEDSLSAFSSWQSINFSSFQDVARSFRISSPFTCNNSRPASASILSNSTDEDAHPESLVLVPSARSETSPQVLLFETDEEDEDEDASAVIGVAADGGRPTIASSNSQRLCSVRTDSSQTFIMPRMHLSDELSPIQLTIVSSTEKCLSDEINNMMDFIQSSSASFSSISISRIALERRPLAEEVTLAKDSDVLLAINDGCKWVAILVALLAETRGDDRLPSFTVVNLLTSNYFENLFEIIRHLRPDQSMKATSLRSSVFLKKLKILIEKESAKKTSASFSNAVRSNSEEIRTCSEIGTSMEKTVSGSIVKPDYKNIERVIRNEIVYSPEYNAVDPLRLSNSLRHMRVLVDSMKEFFVSGSTDDSVANLSSVNRETLWFLCSFSIGIGLGFTLNAFQVFHAFKRSMFVESSPMPEIIVKSSSRELYLRSVSDECAKLADHFIARIDGMSTTMTHFLSRFESWGGVTIGKVCRECKTLSSTVFDSASRGFLKVKSLFSS
ncbi:hypothetical protein OXX59_001858 [Metschnikowia pulcherrima]